MTIELPTEITKASRKSPSSIILYGPPKIGKTTAASLFTTHFKKGKSVILNLERGGTDFNDAVVFSVYDTKDATFETAVSRYNAFIEALRKGHNYEYLIVDSLTVLDEWSDIAGTYDYMQTNQGKNFNVDSQGNKISHTHPAWESATSIGNGYGWRYPREWVLKQYEELIRLIPNVIFLAHVKDKFVDTATLEINQTEINVTGKLKNILCAKVDVVGKMRRDKKSGDLVVNFESASKSAIAGGRCSHLEQDIVLCSKDDDGIIINHWDKIFID